MKINITKLNPEAKIPEYKSNGAAGCDIYSLEEVEIKPGETKLLKTGIAFETPEGHFAMIAPRGSLSLKLYLDMPHSVGIIDEDYRGELLVPLRNLGKETVIIEKHERIAQMIFIKYTKAEFNEVKDLSQTKRGKGGFGSTGKF